jgi:hypothetical protein
LSRKEQNSQKIRRSFARSKQLPGSILTASLFGEIDVNGDGSVSFPELQTYFENLCKEERKKLLSCALANPTDEGSVQTLWQKYAEGDEMTTGTLNLQ